MSTLRLHENCLSQWDVLDKRLSGPEQKYIALPDRPTLLTFLISLLLCLGCLNFSAWILNHGPISKLGVTHVISASSPENTGKRTNIWALRSAVTVGIIL